MNRQISQSRQGADEATVFLVDDDLVTLTVVAQVLRTAGYHVVEFSEATAFLAADPFERHGCAVLDLAMPNVSGIDLQHAIAEKHGTLPVVFLTGAADVRTTVQAMKDGAVDFLLKPFQPAELLKAVEQAVAKSASIRAARAERLAIEKKWSVLTPREKEVAKLLAQGFLNKQIAVELGMSEATAKQHRARLLEKLNLGSVAELSTMVERLRGAGSPG
ncbi:MAG: response regulator transcription factor [Polyangiaceae bacterium]|nr:response regulator transcription factor [Polyangiaceae bacterium]